MDKLLDSSIDNYILNKKYQGAFDLCDQYITKFPNDGYALLKLILVLYKMNNFQLADAVFSKYIKILFYIKSFNDNEFHTLTLILDELKNLKRFQKAIQIIDIFILFSNKNLLLIVYKIELMLLNNQYEEAENYIECILMNINPTFEIILLYSKVAISRCDYENAIERLILLRFLFPNNRKGYEICVSDRIMMHRPIKNRKIRACFVFYSAFQYEHLIPVYEEMKKDSRFEPFILCYTNSPQTIDTIDFFKQKYDEGHIIYGSNSIKNIPSIYDLKPDLVFFQRPYLQDYAYEMHPEILSMYSRIVFINYGITDTFRPIKNLNHTSFIWTFIASSIRHAEYLNNIINCNNIIISGSPKLDIFREELKQINKSDKIHILWNPHIGSTSFIKYIDVIHKILESKKIELTIRPHPFYKSWVTRNKIISSKEYDDILNRITLQGGVIENANSGKSYIPTLVNSDLLITDISTLIIEFSCLNKPCILLSESKEDKRLIDHFYKEFIDNCIYVVKDIDELITIVSDLTINKNDYKKINRTKYLNDILLFPEYNISKFICNSLINKIFEEEFNNTHIYKNNTFKMRSSKSINEVEYLDCIDSGLKKYITARIDIKNKGLYDNNVVVLDCSDKNANISWPNWYKNDLGSGVVIQSINKSLLLKIKCIFDGKLEIILRGVDFRDISGHIFPIYIEYNNLIINNKSIFSSNKVVWHNKPFLYSFDVRDSDVISVFVTWNSVSNSSNIYPSN